MGIDESSFKYVFEVRSLQVESVAIKYVHVLIPYSNGMAVALNYVQILIPNPNPHACSSKVCACTYKKTKKKILTSTRSFPRS